MKRIKSMLLVPALLLSSALYGHTALTESMPADGAVLQEGPTALELTFSTDVQLLKLDIATAEGATLETDFKASATAAKTFSVTLPAMEPAAYAVEWTIVGADGHRVEGNFGFLVDPVAHEPANAESEADAKTQGAAGAHDGH